MKIALFKFKINPHPRDIKGALLLQLQELKPKLDQFGEWSLVIEDLTLVNDDILLTIRNKTKVSLMTREGKDFRKKEYDDWRLIKIHWNLKDMIVEVDAGSDITNLVIRNLMKALPTIEITPLKIPKEVVNWFDNYMTRDSVEIKNINGTPGAQIKAKGKATERSEIQRMMSESETNIGIRGEFVPPGKLFGWRFEINQNGIIGLSATLSLDERKELISMVIEKLEKYHQGKLT